MIKKIPEGKIVLSKDGFIVSGKARMLIITCPYCGKQTLSTFRKSNFMPCCGAINEVYKESLLHIFDAQRLRIEFNEAKRLLLKAEFSSSLRSASIALENYLKIKVNRNDLFGVNLVKYAFDSENGQPPRILINKYSTKAEINEQEGLSLITQGLMKCIRNTIMHNQSYIDAGSTLASILHYNFIIDLIECGSLTNDRKEIRYECDIENLLREEAENYGFQFEIE